MTINKASLDLIKDFEGFGAKAYVDPATGGEPITIGFGHTSAAGYPKVKLGMTVTRKQAEVMLQRDLRKYADHVRKEVKVELNGNQFGALVSFCYNVGPGNFSKSSVLSRVNQKRFSEVPARLKLWNKAAGKVMRGLTRRRVAEGKLFMAVSRDTGERVQPITPKDKPKVPIAAKAPQKASKSVFSVLLRFAVKALFGRSSR